MGFDAAGWREALDERQGGEAPPDAIYEAECTNSDVITRRSDGAQWVKLWWKVISGPHRDAEWESLHTLDRFKPDGERNPGLAFTVDALRKMGYPVDDAEKASSADVIKHELQALEGRGYAVEVKTNGNFTNTYVKEQLRQYAPSLPGTGGDAAPAYGQPRNGATNAILGRDDGGTSAPSQSLTEASTERRDITRTGTSDITSDADAQAFDRSTAPKQGAVDPETGETIPF
jgi:hypothetical protein